MAQFVLANSVEIFICAALLFVMVGFFLRSGTSQLRENMIFSDGFQGLTVATLCFVAILVYKIDDVRSLTLLKEQAPLIIVLCLLVAFQQVISFRRSL